MVAVFLKAIGYQIEKDKFEQAIDVLINGDGNSNAATVTNTATDDTPVYDDLVDFALSFQTYAMNVMVAPPGLPPPISVPN